jgi:transposase
MENSLPQIIYKYGISKSTFYNWKAKYGSFLTEGKLYLALIKQENDWLKECLPI